MRQIIFQTNPTQKPLGKKPDEFYNVDDCIVRSCWHVQLTIPRTCVDKTFSSEASVRFSTGETEYFMLAISELMFHLYSKIQCLLRVRNEIP